MSSIRRINILAGPGAGKSTLAARLFGDLKARHHDVEQITEYIKTWAHQGKKPQGFDQLYVFSKQLKSEEEALRNVNSIVTDSPLITNAAFCVYYCCDYAREVISLAKNFEDKYKSVNLFLERTIDYVEKGRYQNLDQSLEVDKILWSLVSEHIKSPVYKVSLNNYEAILKIVEQEICNINNS